MGLVLLPALGSARKAADSAKCLANLKQFGVSFYTYASDHKDVLPPGRDDLTGGTNSAWYRNWVFLMRDYVNKSGDLFICPTGLNKGEVVKNGTAPASGTQWTIKNTWFTGLSYRYNDYFGHYGAGPGQYPQKVTLRPRRLAFFTHPG